MGAPRLASGSMAALSYLRVHAGADLHRRRPAHGWASAPAALASLRRRGEGPARAPLPPPRPRALRAAKLQEACQGGGRRRGEVAGGRRAGAGAGKEEAAACMLGRGLCHGHGPAPPWPRAPPRRGGRGRGRPRRKEAGREGEGGGASAAGAALRGREGARPAPAWEEKGGGGGRRARASPWRFRGPWPRSPRCLACAPGRKVGGGPPVFVGDGAGEQSCRGREGGAVERRDAARQGSRGREERRASGEQGRGE